MEGWLQALGDALDNLADKSEDESLDDAVAEKPDAARTQMLWRRWWHRPHGHHRHNPHWHNPHSHNPHSHSPVMGGGKNPVCECTGDPHCKPFTGNWFDIQYEGDDAQCTLAAGSHPQCERVGLMWRVGLQLSSTWSPVHGARRKCRHVYAYAWLSVFVDTGRSRPGDRCSARCRWQRTRAGRLNGGRAG